MKDIGAVTIGKLIEAHYEKDEHKFKAYAEFIAEAYKERGEERAERIIRSKIDGSYKNKPVAVTLDKEIKENDRRLKPIDVSKYTVTESGNVIRTDNKETLKNALERITELEIENAELRAIAENQQSSNMERYFKNKELEKENAELKEKLNIRSCQNCRKYNRTCPNDGSCKNYSKWEGYKNPQLTEAKEIINAFLDFEASAMERGCYIADDTRRRAEDFIKE